MKLSDRELRKMAMAERLEMPENVRAKINDTLRSLPDGKVIRLKKRWGKAVASAAAVLVLLFIALPNMNSGICRAMSDIPGIGGLVKVVTFREYKQDDEHFWADVNMPAIDPDGESDEFIRTAAKINEEVELLTDELIEYLETTQEMTEDQAHAAIYEDYRIITDSEEWFTLEVKFWFGVGSSNTIYKYYNIDKSTGGLVSLGDLFSSDEYIEAISGEVKEQMRRQMKEDDMLKYWIDEDPEFDFEKIDGDMNFYFAENGNIVIVFEKYEVAPGYMGCPSFEIPENVYREYLK